MDDVAVAYAACGHRAAHGQHAVLGAAPHDVVGAGADAARRAERHHDAAECLRRVSRDGDAAGGVRQRAVHEYLHRLRQAATSQESPVSYRSDKMCSDSDSDS